MFLQIMQEPAENADLNHTSQNDNISLKGGSWWCTNVWLQGVEMCAAIGLLQKTHIWHAVIMASYNLS